MHLTGTGVWGMPPDPPAAVRLLRRAYALGVRLFDSAWYYGPEVTHRLLREAFSPYPADLVLVTKVGNSRGVDRSWVPVLQPRQLVEGCSLDRRLLGVDSLPLVLLRWQPRVGDDEFFTEAFGCLLDLKRAGHIQSVGLSNVSLRHVQAAAELCELGAVSNAFSVTSQRDIDVLRWCTARGVTFLPYYPLMGGDAVRRPAVLRASRELGLSPAQVALAWLVAQSPVMVPIPGTRDAGHLEDNITAVQTRLPPETLEQLSSGMQGGRLY